MFDTPSLDKDFSLTPDCYGERQVRKSLEITEEWHYVKRRILPFWRAAWFLVALVSFFFGVLLLPIQLIPSNPITNPIAKQFSSYFNPPAQPSDVSAIVDVPWIHIPQLNYTSTQPLGLFFSLSDGQLVAGLPLNLTVSLDAPPSLIGLYGSPIITVSLDSALVYPFTRGIWSIQDCYPTDTECSLNAIQPSFDRLIFNTSSILGPWVASQRVEYTVSGSFGATVHIFPNPFKSSFNELPVPSLDLPFHTSQLYTIASQETVANQRNGQFVTSLTLIILGVASLGIRGHAEPDYARERPKRDDSRKYVV